MSRLSFVLFLAIFLALSGTLSAQPELDQNDRHLQAREVGHPSYLPGPKAWPWNICNSPAYRQNLRQEECYAEFAALNGVPNTKEGLESFKRGQLVRVPLLPGTEDYIRARIEPGIRADADRRAAKIIEEREETILQLQKDLAAQNSFWNLTNPPSVGSVLACLLLGGMIIYLLVKRHKTEADLVIANEKIKQMGLASSVLRGQYAQQEATLDDAIPRLRRYEHAVHSQMVEVNIPPEVGMAFGARVLYLPKARPIVGDAAVTIFNGKEFIDMKVENVEKFLLKSSGDAAMMDFYRIDTSAKSGARTAKTPMRAHQPQAQP